jgi:hypothetical protein
MLILTLVSLFFMTASAKPKETPTPQEFCQAIESNKYQAQCESALHKATFDEKALKVCLTHRASDDYRRKSCIEVIRNKTYTQTELDQCLAQKKIPLNKCLHDSGTNTPPPAETSEDSSSISN